MTRVVLVRHGESLWNVERRIQGQSGPGLSERGHQQVAVTAAWLAAAYPDGALVCSDLIRCRETVAPLEAALGRAALLDEGLRERHFGAWTGRLVADLAGDEPERFERWRQGEEVIAEIGGEDTPTLQQRVVATVERLEAELMADTLIVVTHGGPVWHGTRGLVGLPHAVLGGVGNASITEIVRNSVGGRRLASWNQTAHLPPPLRRTWMAADAIVGTTPPPAGT